MPKLYKSAFSCSSLGSTEETRSASGQSFGRRRPVEERPHDDGGRAQRGRRGDVLLLLRAGGPVAAGGLHAQEGQGGALQQEGEAIRGQEDAVRKLEGKLRRRQEKPHLSEKYFDVVLPQVLRVLCKTMRKGKNVKEKEHINKMIKQKKINFLSISIISLLLFVVHIIEN